MLKKIFPFVEWFEGYDSAALRSDVIGGVTVALVLVPQSMAYAQLAGLPAYYGLYASFLPPMVASLFGSSRQLATGPVAVVSLMTSAALEPLATAGSEAYIGYAVLLALLVGLFQFLLGAFRLGAIINLLSHPVVNGFTTAAAIIIATSQLSKVFGVSVDKAPHHVETVIRVLEAAVHRTHWPTLAIAVLAFATMIILRRVNPRIPNVLVAVILTTAIASVFQLERVREIPVSAIRSDSVVTMVEEYNALVEKRQTVEELRLSHASRVGEIEQTESSRCQSCHELRDLERFGATSGGGLSEGDSVIALHQMAGLLDSRLEDARLAESELREKLREVALVEVATSEGNPVLALRDDVPWDRRADGTIWRFKVGANPMDLEALRLNGGVSVVGRIPPGLPAPKAPSIDASVVLRLFPSAIIISVLGFMEAISIAKAIAARTKQRLDPNQELIGQGLANLAGCMTQSYAVSGSFSRSAVNLAAGGQTGLSNVFSSAVVVIVLLVLSPTLYNLPQATLAAIIMMAVAGLINVDGFVHAWRAQRYDGVVSVLTFVTTLALAPHLEWGIALGMILSMGGYLFRTMRPKVAELSFHPDGTLRDVDRHRLAKCENMAVIRFEGPLNFASATYLEDAILARVAQKRELRHVVLAAGGINEIDASGEETLRRVLDRLQDGGIGFSVGGLNDVPMDVLRRTHLLEQIGEEHLWATPAQAVAGAFDESHVGQDEERCPLRRLLLNISELSLHSDGALRNAERHDLPQCSRIALLRFEGALSFANTGALLEQVSDHLMGRPDLNHVVLVFHSVAAIDAAAATRLGDVVRDLRESGYGVALSGPTDDVLEQLRSGGAIEILGEENLFGTQAAAISGIYARAHREGEEVGCPLRPLAPRLTELVPDAEGGLREAAKGEDRLCRAMAVFRIEGPNALSFPEALAEEFRQWTQSHGSIGHAVLIGHGVHHVDASVAEQMARLIATLESSGTYAVIGRFSERVFTELRETDVYARMGRERFFRFEAEAILAVVRHSHADRGNPECPYVEWLDGE